MNNIAAAARYSSAYTPSEPAPNANEGEKSLHERISQGVEADQTSGCRCLRRFASPSFEGVPTVKQHQMVNEVRKDDIKGMHSLQLRTAAKKTYIPRKI
ncbi:hypothetical protein BJ742DRAFT_783006 [Cladochytrium replicatum]|nr:hypothetical protein BJ742DRAFT_783006 [Cladochytrium replicatum]